MNRRSLLALFLIALVIILMPYYFQLISPVSVAVPPTYGCTDPGATNYDAIATIDDGTCMYGAKFEVSTDLIYVAALCKFNKHSRLD